MNSPVRRHPQTRRNMVARGLALLSLALWGLTPLAGQEGLIPAFRVAPDLELRRLAQPFTCFDKVGRRFAVLGFESGSFEAWAYPLKLFRDFELSFFVGRATEPIAARDLVRYISVTPAATTLTYVYQSFTVRATFVTPVREPGALLLLAVDSTVPLTVVCAFVPVLQPMWPAGLGGQYARWDRDLRAYLISESSRQNHAYVGSPAAEGVSYTPAHMLSDRPNRFKIVLEDPAAVRDRFIPIVMAGGKGERAGVRRVYQALAAEPERFYREALEHYRRLRAATLRVQTPDDTLNLALEWAKVAYDNLVVENPDLGTGLVAGLGPSGTGGRPGFGWFFGGDAYINSFSLNSLGAFATVRQALAFTQKWQREDGKMAHELSQAAGYLDWFGAYPYGYLHGDTTPFYLTAMYDTYRATGDLAFVRQSWASLKRAYAWCRTTDADGDGLMDNQKAGLGALEFGALTGIQTDVYLGAVWVRAAYCMQRLAQAVGDSAQREQAAADFERARAAFDRRFWDPEQKQYAYAFNADGRRVPETTPWSAVGLMWNLGEPERSRQTLRKLASHELTTDWGTRSLSIHSPLFEPLNYNYGAVWPFLTSWVATAHYRHGLALQGYAALMTTVRHTFDNALGYVTEVFSGYQNVWPQEAVPHQGFCTAGAVLPLVRGLLGLEGHAPERTVTFAPQFPADWQHVEIENYRVGNEAFSFSYRRSSGQLNMKFRNQGRESYTVRFGPALGIGTRLRAVRLDGEPVAFRTLTTPQSVQPWVEFELRGVRTVEVAFEPTVEVLPFVPHSRTGDRNRGLKIVWLEKQDNRLVLTLEGLAGESYRLSLVGAEAVASVEGGTLAGDGVTVAFPAGAGPGFVRRQVSLKLRSELPQRR